MTEKHAALEPTADRVTAPSAPDPVGPIGRAERRGMEPEATVGNKRPAALAHLTEAEWNERERAKYRASLFAGSATACIACGKPFRGLVVRCECEVEPSGVCENIG